jgi:hypothetical protein
MAVFWPTITKYSERTVISAKAVDEYVMNKEDVWATTEKVFHIVRKESQSSIASTVMKIGTPIDHFD